MSPETSSAFSKLAETELTVFPGKLALNAKLWLCLLPSELSVLVNFVLAVAFQLEKLCEPSSEIEFFWLEFSAYSDFSYRIPVTAADIKKVDFSVKNFAALPVPSSVFSLQGLRLSLFFSAMPSKPNEHLMFCQRLQVYWGLIFI